MGKRLPLIATACAFTLIGFAAGVLLPGALPAMADGGGSGAISVAPSELVKRIEVLEAGLAAAGSAQTQTSDRELARIADELHDASDRWLREISGNLVQISRELENIRRAIEAK